MSGSIQKNGSYSADVQMTLAVNGQTFDIGQLGPDFLILRNAGDHPPTAGEIIMSIDGRVRQWPVRLPEGIASTKTRTPIEGYRPVNGTKDGCG